MARRRENGGEAPRKRHKLGFQKPVDEDGNEVEARPGLLSRFRERWQENREARQERRAQREEERQQRREAAQQPVQMSLDETEEDRHEQELRRDAKLIAVTLVMVFWELAVLGRMGKLGEWLSEGSYGLFGWLAHVLPLAITFAYLFMVANPGSRKARRRLWAGIAAFVLWGILLETGKSAHLGAVSLQVGQIFRDSAAGKNGGGALMGSLCWLLHHFLGPVGLWITLAAGFLICFTFLTDKAWITIFTNRQKEKGPIIERSQKALSEAGQKLEEASAEHRKQREERRILQKEKKPRWGGRMSDTTLKPAGAEPEPEEDEDDLLQDPQETDFSFGDEEQLHELSLDPERARLEDPLSIRVEPSTGAGVPDFTSFTSPLSEDLQAEDEDDDEEDEYEEPFPAPLRGESAAAVVGEDDDEPIDGEDEEEPQEFDLPIAGTSVIDADHSWRRDVEGGLEEEPEDDGLDDADDEPWDDDEPVQEVHPQRQSAPARTAPATAVRGAASQSAAKSVPAGAARSAPASGAKKYVFPSLDLLTRGTPSAGDDDAESRTKTELQEALRTFGVEVTIEHVSRGPAVTRYEIRPSRGVRVSRILNLSDDIQLALGATEIRIEAPVPGTNVIGIEVPNRDNEVVALRDILESAEFKRTKSRLAFGLGKDIGGRCVAADIERMPHLLIAGATGSGKSVCINTIIMSILYHATPEEVKLLMIDPKVVELSVYNNIPHLLVPVVTDPKKAAASLNWAVAEMERRYKLFSDACVRDIKGYNAQVKALNADGGEPENRPLPRIVIIVDELADLMMTAKSDVETAIVRLTQLARAAGIHLVIATQRPSVNVITGLIKANMPSRIAFSVTSQVDSRTILDMAGAEKLLGKGDMLYFPQNLQKPVRVQGAFVSDEEVSRVVEAIRANGARQDEENDKVVDQIEHLYKNAGGAGGADSEGALDPLFVEAGRFIIEKDKASIGYLQRGFKIGFNRAARIMDQLSEAGVVSSENGTRARTILMTLPEFNDYVDNNML